MAKSKKAKTRRPLLLPAIFLLFAAIAVVLVLWQFQGLPNFLSPERNAASWSVLEEIKNLQELNTAIYELQAVFPFDFVDEERVDWEFLKFQYDSEPSLFLEKTDPAWHQGGRRPAEWAFAELYNLCRQVGIDPGRPDYRFVVISAAVEAGIDLDMWIADVEDGNNGNGLGRIRISLDTEGLRGLEIPEPPVEIRSFVIRDRDMVSQGFPDVPLSPEAWGTLTDALEPELAEMALEAGLLEKAQAESRTLLTEIFIAAGYDYVEFSNAN